MNRGIEGGPISPGEMESENPKEKPPGYWSFIELFDPAEARTHLDEVMPIKDFDAFFDSLDKDGQETLRRFREKGIQGAMDKKLLNLLAEQYADYAAQKAESKKEE